MDYKPTGPPWKHVFLLILLDTHWRLVLPAPTPNTCTWEETCNLTKLLEFEAKQLKETYEKYHHSGDYSLPEHIPTANISGGSISERLQDIYAKSFQFRWHILEVATYQGELLPDPKPIVDSLEQVSNLLVLMNRNLRRLEPELAVLTTPAPPQLEHDDDDYIKKVYGSEVIYTLTDWLTNVLQVLDCDKNEEKCY